MTYAHAGGEGGAMHLTARPDEVAAFLVRHEVASFTLRYDVGEQPQQRISFGAALGCPRYASFDMAAKTRELAPHDLASFIELMARSTHLAIAAVYDRNYMSWQRCSDPERYLANYGPIDQFRILHPMPPPLHDLKKLDISRNPGRYDSVSGGPALACADLWLGPAFWNHAACQKQDLLAQRWLEIRDTEHFLYIKSYPEPFTRPDGQQGEIQRRLWQLLFCSDSWWPPEQGPSAQAGPSAPGQAAGRRPTEAQSLRLGDWAHSDSAIGLVPAFSPRTDFAPDARLEKMAEAYAADCVEFAAVKHSVRLDYSAASVPMLEQILGQLHSEGPTAKPEPELRKLCMKLGSYLAETYRRLHGGQWGLVANWQPGFRSAGGLVCYPWNRAYFRVKRGAEEDVAAWFRYLVEKGGA